MKACQIITVINGREKGVIDPRYSLTGGDMQDLVDYGVDDITIRRPPVRFEWIHRIRIDDAETFLRLAGWVQWELDKNVWLRKGCGG